MRSSRPPRSSPTSWSFATTVWFEADSDLDNVFGIKLALPGAGINAWLTGRRSPPKPSACSSEVAHSLYSRGAQARLSAGGRSAKEDFSARILECAVNPAEIEDIVVLCQTTALYRRRIRQTTGAIFTREILETAIARV